MALPALLVESLSCKMDLAALLWGMIIFLLDSCWAKDDMWSVVRGVELVLF
jgi:hypothetical protein